MKKQLIHFILIILIVASNGSCRLGVKGGEKLFRLLIREMTTLNVASRAGARLTIAEMEAISARYGGKITVTEIRALSTGKMTATEMRAISQRFGTQLSKQESEVLAARTLRPGMRIPMRVKPPSPYKLGTIMSKPLEGSKAAKDIVHSADLEFTLYDSQGYVATYSKAIDEALVYRSVERLYKRPLVGIVDEVLTQMRLANKPYTSKTLEELIHSTVKTKLETRMPFTFDVSTGNLTLNVEFQNGGQIIGTVDMYGMVKKGVIGAGGYYIYKKTV